MSSQYPLPELWTHVVRNNKKGKQKQQQQNVSFNPTLITPPVSPADSSQNVSAANSTPAPIAMVRPFMKGVEEDAVFIDLATVQNRNLLDKAFVKFNEEAERTDMYEDFLGYRKQTRQYLGHHYLETLWLPTSAGRKHLIENGITLEDGTYLKGFPSFPEDANIVRVTMEKLPFLPAVQLKKEMAERFSCFGDVLDHGIFKTENGIFQGGRKPDHCRADCPDYHKWAICYHCNKHGHVPKNCDRNNAESVPAKVRAVEKSPAKPRKQKGAKPTPPKRTDSERRSKPVEDKDHIMPDASQPNAGSSTPEASQQQTKMTGNTIMEENNTNRKLSDADALNSVSKDVRRSHPGFDPSKAEKNDAKRMSGDDTDTIVRNLTPPAPSEYDILVLQETHATNTLSIDILNNHFNSKSSLWTQHCGIIALNKHYTINLILEGIDGGRYILASVHHTRDIQDSTTTTPIATILNIYGRASLSSYRSALYTELLGIPIVQETITNILSPTFIMGDFNYQYKDRRLDETLACAPKECTDLLDDYYIDIFGDDKQMTWHSGRSLAILDYVFCSTNAHHQITSFNQQYLSQEWTDHELLGFSFQYQDINGRGPGSWKANPFLARNQQFRKA
ncbi:uncharacterized protein ATC70_002816 [Mucor velutinosus]|uniref:CCHC-type domain-containing protein n=1 Tax=Mucor velutinosus TaxID=708070 RepID=A0AAN7DD13_9FUNG|nr:hypothetical protein ATC70_002816 [Mucor velutinosus]